MTICVCGTKRLRFANPKCVFSANLHFTKMSVGCFVNKDNKPKAGAALAAPGPVANREEGKHLQWEEWVL